MIAVTAVCDLLVAWAPFFAVLGFCSFTAFVLVLVYAAVVWPYQWLRKRLRREPQAQRAAPKPLPPLDHRRLVPRPWQTAAEYDRRFNEIVRNLNDTNIPDH